MKYLMKVGDQLDLNVSYDGGAVDGVTYNAPDGYDNKVSVTADGIVTALGLGEGVVNVLSGGAIVGTIVFEVLTEAAYVAQQGIRDGSKELVVDADVVPQGPPPSVQISLNTMTSASQGGYIAFGDVLAHSPAWQAFDADLDSIAQAYAPDANTFQTVGQILPAPKVLTQYTITTRQYSNQPTTWELQGSTNTTSGSDGTWVTIQSVTNHVWSFLPPYTNVPENVTSSTTPWGVNVETKNFSVTNTTAYKAYRIRLTYSTGNGIYNFYSLVFTGY